LVGVALALVDGAPVLQLLVEEALGPRDAGRLARLARVGARDLAELVPQGLAVGRVHRRAAQAADDAPVDARHAAGGERAGRRLVERRELVGEAGHRAADARAAGDHAAA